MNAVSWPLVEDGRETWTTQRSAESRRAHDRGTGRQGPSLRMDAVNRLIREHNFLRSKLRVLESVLEIGQEAWLVLREVSFALWKQLQAHDRREEKIVVACRAALGASPWMPVIADHAAEQQHLLMVRQLFMEEPKSFKALRPQLDKVMAELYRHMDQQEAELFPMLRHLLALRRPTESNLPPARVALAETMSVQEVISRYPGARGTFEALFIDNRVEGYDCLDEVAWRHGMESQELVTALEEGMARSAAPSGNDGEVETAGVCVGAQ